MKKIYKYKMTEVVKYTFSISANSENEAEEKMLNVKTDEADTKEVYDKGFEFIGVEDDDEDNYDGSDNF